VVDRKTYRNKKLFIVKSFQNELKIIITQQEQIMKYHITCQDGVGYVVMVLLAKCMFLLLCGIK
jgi:hypothetical protein